MRFDFAYMTKIGMCTVFGITHSVGWFVGWLVVFFLCLVCAHSLHHDMCMLDLSLLLFAWCLLMRAFIHCCLKCLNITKRKQRKFYTLWKWIRVLCVFVQFIHSPSIAIKWNKIDENASWHETKWKTPNIVNFNYNITTISNRWHLLGCPFY